MRCDCKGWKMRFIFASCALTTVQSLLVVCSIARAILAWPTICLPPLRKGSTDSSWYKSHESCKDECKESYLHVSNEWMWFFFQSYLYSKCTCSSFNHFDHSVHFVILAFCHLFNHFFRMCNWLRPKYDCKIICFINLIVISCNLWMSGTFKVKTIV